MYTFVLWIPGGNDFLQPGYRCEHVESDVARPTRATIKDLQGVTAILVFDGRPEEGKNPIKTYLVSPETKTTSQVLAEARMHPEANEGLIQKAESQGSGLWYFWISQQWQTAFQAPAPHGCAAIATHNRTVYGCVYQNDPDYLVLT